MNIEHISLDIETAQLKLKEYRKKVGKLRGTQISKEVRAEYEAAIAAYRALAKGTSIIDVGEALINSPRDTKHRPKLAIARADRRAVRFRWEYNGMVFRPEDSTYYYPVDTLRFETVPPVMEHRYDGFARVPMIAADVRPTTGKDKDYFILWEVEEWKDNTRTLRPDYDPYLLKHLGGNLYAVIAEWELTDVERAVMTRFHL